MVKKKQKNKENLMKLWFWWYDKDGGNVFIYLLHRLSYLMLLIRLSQAWRF